MVGFCTGDLMGDWKSLRSVSCKISRKSIFFVLRGNIPGEIAKMSFSGRLGLRHGKEGSGDLANEGVAVGLGVMGLRGEVGSG
jgi:hypothetical protein